MFIEVFTIHFDSNKYEDSEGLKTFLCKRISDKFTNKTKDLPEKEKELVYVFPILSGLTPEIIIENKKILKNIDNLRNCGSKINCISPHIFGNLEYEYYDIFSIEEILKKLKQ